MTLRKLVLSATVALLASAAQAQLSVTLLTPAQSGLHNGTVTYEATLTNLGGSALDITGSGFTVIGTPAGLSIDDSPLFLNFPATFGSGASFTGELFNIFIGDSATISVGDYFGDFTVQTSAGDTTQNWQLSVVSGAGSAPEPTTVALLLAGTLVVLRRRPARTPSPR